MILLTDSWAAIKLCKYHPKLQQGASPLNAALHSRSDSALAEVCRISEKVQIRYLISLD
jgi:hypothetical protein